MQEIKNVSFLLLLVVARRSHADNKPSAHCLSSMTLIDSLTDPGKYDRSTKPCKNGNPVVVHASMYVVSINKVQESDMEFDIQIYFRQTWKDERLAFSAISNESYIILDPRVVWEKLWMPDPYFENEKSGIIHSLMRKNLLVRLLPDGTIFFSVRLTLTLSCPMAFHDFPMDIQVCRITFLSYAYTDKSVLYKWLTNKTETSVYFKELKLPQFAISKLEIGSRVETYPKIGNFTILTLDIHFHRRIAFYLTRNYIPAVLITIVSWLSFWIDRDCAPARVGIGITTILTITTLMIGLGQQELPVVSYIKALDWYFIGCFAFVFTALFEFAVVNYFDVRHRRHILKVRRERRSAHLEKEREKVQVCDDKFNATYGLDFNDNSLPAVGHEDDSDSKDLLTQSEISDLIDSYVRKIYPLLFIVFNIVYWFTYNGFFVQHH